MSQNVHDQKTRYGECWLFSTYSIVNSPPCDKGRVSIQRKRASERASAGAHVRPILVITMFYRRFANLSSSRPFPLPCSESVTTVMADITDDS